MTYSLIFHPEAELEYIKAYQWYEKQKEGLEKRFEEKVEHRLNLISINPEAYGLIKMNIREVAVESFPFTIVYQISKQDDIVYILAIYHNRRNPKKKFRKP